jgi:hypothetical protein
VKGRESATVWACETERQYHQSLHCEFTHPHAYSTHSPPRILY